MSMKTQYNNTNPWDFIEPNEGHEMRFLKKLEATQNTSKKTPYLLYINWAAIITISICFSVYYFQNKNNNIELNNTPQNYYASQVELQISSLKALENTFTKPIIDDAISEIMRLEMDYLKLENERKVSGTNELLLNAMIINLQTRIEFLQRVQSQINQINELKESANENTL
jgi:hypothetical protein